jgi:hypothetical protein
MVAAVRLVIFFRNCQPQTVSGHNSLPSRLFWSGNRNAGIETKPMGVSR